MSDALSQLGINAAEAATLISDNRSSNMITLSILALVAYDTVLTFPQEVRCIWQRKWTGATLLYATIRYVTLLNMAIEVAGGLFVPGNTLECNIVYFSGVTTTIIAFIAIAVFECLRVWVISGKSWRLACAVLVFALLAPAMDIYVNSLPFTSILIKSGPLSGCWPSQTSPSFLYFGPVVRAAAVCSDIMVLIVTLYTTVQTVRTSQRILASTKYTSLLLYTGVIQFVLLLIFDILDILFDVLAIGTIETNLSQVVIINEGLSTIIICRLILNLRSVHLQDGSQDSLGTTRSSVRFTNSIIGNLGAPTRRDSLSFNSAELDNILENEETIYSENPLEVAMVDQIEEMEIEMVNTIGTEEAGPMTN